MTFGSDPSHRANAGERGTAVQAETLGAHVYQKAQRVLSEHELPLDSFTDLYGAETIARDTERVRDLEAAFAEKERRARESGRAGDEHIKKAATVFEAMTFEGIRAHGWLGPDAAPFKTSRYDDYTNGIDLAVEIQRGEDPAQQLALAIDVTFGQKAQEKKFAKIREEILREELGKLKYFRSERSNFRGELSMLPKVVIGIEPRNVIRMSQLWANDEKKLAILPAQMAMLEEITVQLEAFSLFARNHNKMSAISAYRRAKTILADILQTKRKEVRYQTLDDDRVYQAILEGARSFSSL